MLKLKYMWRKTRKSLFISIISLIILSIIFYKLHAYIFPKPSCFDNKLNGDESDIDCGGSCQKVCNEKILPIISKTARAIKTEKGLYDLIGFLQNNNRDKNISNNKINYKFTIFDLSGKPIKEYIGKTDLLVGQTFPIIVQNVPLDLESSGNDISKVILTTSFDNNEWLKVDSIFGESFFSSSNEDYERLNNNITQLSLDITNPTKARFRDIPIRITLENEEGNIVAVNETILRDIAGRSSQKVSFTWRNPLEIEDPIIKVYSIISPSSDFR